MPSHNDVLRRSFCAVVLVALVSLLGHTSLDVYGPSAANDELLDAPGAPAVADPRVAASKKKLSMIISYPARFVDPVPPGSHWAEIVAAIRTNLANPFLDQFVVVLDSASPAANCSHFVPTVLGFPFGDLPRPARNQTASSSSSSSSHPRDRLLCINRRAGQPNYLEMFEYALVPQVTGEIAILANADQVVDESIDRVRYVRPGMLLVVSSKGFVPYTTPYVREFYDLSMGTNSSSAQKNIWDRCGKGTVSWDAWVFHKEDLLDPGAGYHEVPMGDEEHPTDPVPRPSRLDPGMFLRRTILPQPEGPPAIWTPPIDPPAAEVLPRVHHNSDSNSSSTIGWKFFYMNELAAEVAARNILREAGIFRSIRNVCEHVNLWHYHFGPKEHAKRSEEPTERWLVPVPLEELRKREKGYVLQEVLTTKVVVVRNASVADSLRSEMERETAGGKLAGFRLSRMLEAQNRTDDVLEILIPNPEMEKWYLASMLCRNDFSKCHHAFF